MHRLVSTIAVWVLLACSSQLSIAESPVIVLEKRGVNLPVASQAQFAAYRERNPAVPAGPEEVLALSRMLLAREAPDVFAARPFKMLTLDGDEGEAADVICGEYDYGRLFAGLQNPNLDADVRQQIVDQLEEALPTFQPPETFGHFRFFYTTDGPSAADPDDIKATAEVLNQAWDRFVTDFVKPKHRVIDGQEIIDVRVYDLPPDGLYGQTNSFWDHIELDNVLVVADPCKRQTTPAHELFHRVQYAYGYVTGSQSIPWATEGTAAWSQKHCHPEIGDYKTRMEAGLESTNVGLEKRSYDALHFWIYSGQRANSELDFVRDCWKGFAADGMIESVRKVVTARIGADLALTAAEWNHANVRKDFEPLVVKFDYPEDETSTMCGNVTYGPLRRAISQTHIVAGGGNPQETTGVAGRMGADHHRYKLQAGVNKIKLKVTPEAGSAVICSFVAVNGTNVVDEVPPQKAASYEYAKDFGMAGVTEVYVTVVGAPDAAEYTIVLDQTP